MPVTPRRSSKAARDVDRVLAGQRVGDQQHFVRIGGGLDVGRLRHQPLVDRHTAGGVEHHHVVAPETTRFHGAAGDLHGTLARNDRQGIDTDLLAKDRQLFLRRRSPRIERGHQHPALVAPGEALGDLGRGGGLARALQADHQDADRRRRVEVDRLRVRTQHLHELIVDDLDDLLSGRHRRTTSAPTARALTLSVKDRTTSRATSASSKARRTSRSAALTSSSVSAPRRVKPLRMAESLSERPSNMSIQFPLR